MAKKELTYEEYKEEVLVTSDTVVKVTEEELTNMRMKSWYIGFGIGLVTCGLSLAARMYTDSYSKKKSVAKNTDRFIKDNLGK